MSKWEVVTLEYSSTDEIKEKLLKYVDERMQDRKALVVANRETDRFIPIGKDTEENRQEAEIIANALNNKG